VGWTLGGVESVRKMQEEMRWKGRGMDVWYKDLKARNKLPYFGEVKKKSFSSKWRKIASIN
jgi:hypothetical protein